MATKRAVSLLAGASAGILITWCAEAQAFTFVEIANSATSDLSEFDAYSINDLGDVAFVAESGGQENILLGSGGPISTLIDASAGFADFSFVDINSSGTLVFEENTVPGIFSFEGGVVTPIITQATAPALIGFPLNNDLAATPMINDNGVVAFRARNFDLAPVPQGLYRAEAGTISPIAESPEFDIFRFAINNNDEVAFFSISDIAPDGDAVFIDDGTGMPAPLPDPLGFSTIEGPTLNDDGVVAFDTLFLDDIGEPRQGIFTQDGGDITLIVDDSGEFMGLGRPAINNLGDVVFQAELDAGPDGIFVGSDSAGDRAIGLGDALVGRTVNGLFFDQQTGLNNQGQFAFRASFVDGTTGIYRADPSADAQPVPEPSAGLVAFVLLAIGTLYKRKIK